MGLKAIFQTAGRTAFRIAGDVKVPCTYTAVIDGDIEEPVDPVNGEEPVVDEPALWPVDVVFGQFSIMERVNSNIQPEDVPGTVLVEDMYGKPKRGHTVMRLDTMQVYSVIGYTADPAGVTYRLHLRGV